MQDCKAISDVVLHDFAKCKRKTNHMIINNFKKLIEENKSMLNELTLGLFEDSIRCFDAGIYRQAYLLAYQGFTQYIRNIVRDAKMPTGYDPNKWNGVQAKLNNEKEFDL